MPASSPPPTRRLTGKSWPGGAGASLIRGMQWPG